MMELGAVTGCHQKPERSFYVCGYQMPVCARCTGVILGYLIAIPLYARKGLHFILSLAGGFIMLTDWMLQQSKIRESNNIRRLLTGFFGGFGIMSIQLHFIKRFVMLLRR